MAVENSLLDALSGALPIDHTFNIYHVLTSPSACQPIFAAPPNSPPTLTTCESHFLAISLPSGEKLEDELLVFALEILIYTSDDLVTIFVAKADSTGFLKLLDLPANSGSLARDTSTAFLAYLVHRKKGDRRIVLSLFARSQNQYLFPGSIENTDKHVLDDRKLIKWWCRTIDPILREYEGEVKHGEIQPHNSSVTASAYLVVPGSDHHETKIFFPQSAKDDPFDRPRWTAGHPLYRLADDPTNPPRCLVPRFPDDPKARFLDALDEEIPDIEDGNGRWRSVKSLEQFWEMMSYRQECSAGRLVGFLWVVFTSNESQKHKISSTASSIKREVPHPEPALPISTKSQAPAEIGDKDAYNVLNEPPTMGIDRSQILPPSSPLLGPTEPGPSTSDNGCQQYSPSLAHGGSTSATETLTTSEIPTPVPLPPSTEDLSPSVSLLLDTSQYRILINRLLELDFAGTPDAGKSTSEWLSFARSLVKVPSWGATVTGTRFPNQSSATLSGTAAQPTILPTGFLRKRKQDPEANSAASKEDGMGQSVNVLSTGLVRKKVKNAS
ncbi:MAG: hypothetical protein Q9227_008336 [Pyrenula ochraceoflavens]